MASLVQIVRCMHLKQVLCDIAPTPVLNYWRLINGDLLNLAILDWLEIFGSDLESAHWKIIANNEEEKRLFKDNLFKYLEVSPEQWDEKWERLKSFKDDLAAHHLQEGPIAICPHLDLVLKSSCFYYEYLESLAPCREPGDEKY